MKNLEMLKIAAVLGILVCAVPASAEPVDFSTTPWEASIQGGAAMLSDDASEAGAQFQGRITYDVSPHVALGFTAAWMSMDFSASSSSGEIDFGDIHGIPLLATIVLRMPIESTENRLVPYLVGGVGTIFWSFNENEGIDSDDDNTFAAQVGAGVDYFFTDRIALFGEATYLFSDDLETDFTQNGSSGRINENVDNIMLGAGLKARF